MVRSNWIAYINPLRFSSNPAGTQRIYGIARSLTGAGYDVIIGSGDSSPATPVVLDQRSGKGRLYCVGLNEAPLAKTSVITKSYRWFVALGERTVQWLDKQPTRPSHVIVYAPQAPMVFRLLRWCRSQGVTLICDVVEWYNPWHVQGGPLGPSNMSIKLALQFLNLRSDGIIVISSYLANYYQRRGCRVICIPPTFDVKELPISALDPKITPQVLSLAYAGTPGKKDLINNVIEAMLRLDPSGKRVHLTLAGSLEEEILNLPALRGREVSELPDCIEVLGHIPHEKALELIGRADFLPLLRANQRYAQAGFPTKVVESLALGTPVICNLTSDLGEYIHDGVEGIVCADYSTDAFAAALERALALTPQQRTEMRKAAREQAERSFDYRVYADSLLSFLNEMRQCI